MAPKGPGAPRKTAPGAHTTPRARGSRQDESPKKHSDSLHHHEDLQDRTPAQIEQQRNIGLANIAHLEDTRTHELQYSNDTSSLKVETAKCSAVIRHHYDDWEEEDDASLVSGVCGRRGRRRRFIREGTVGKALALTIAVSVLLAMAVPCITFYILLKVRLSQSV